MLYKECAPDYAEFQLVYKPNAVKLIDFLLMVICTRPKDLYRLCDQGSRNRLFVGEVVA